MAGANLTVGEVLEKSLEALAVGDKLLPTGAGGPECKGLATPKAAIQPEQANGKEQAKPPKSVDQMVADAESMADVLRQKVEACVDMPTDKDTIEYQKFKAALDAGSFDVRGAQRICLAPSFSGALGSSVLVSRFGFVFRGFRV